MAEFLPAAEFTAVVKASDPFQVALMPLSPDSQLAASTSLRWLPGVLLRFSTGLETAPSVVQAHNRYRLWLS